ncbi:MAG TPA: hypothetical protein PKD15_05600 [Candidatus Saccharibacteria bacterium]|mgnify:CR=1 FL=1|jgi:septation ring formation regulator EzrA|nr:hypothetical protein [Candidatus Saccharibacteria bacterium]
METIQQTTEIREIGQRLHTAETAIGVGRRALSDLLRQEPVDEQAVESTRHVIKEARLQRNALRRELELARPLQQYDGCSWLR